MVLGLPGGEPLDAKHPNFPDTWRAGFINFATSGTDYSYTLSYTSGCTFTAGPVTFPIAMPVTGGFLMTNPFPELKSTDAAQRDFLQLAPRRAYQASVSSTQMVTVTVTGSAGCGPTAQDMVGGLLSTNDSVNNRAVNPPVAKANGDLIATFTYKDFTFDWNLTAQSEP
jgi:hypothetical protein